MLSNVRGETSTFSASCSSPSQKPAIPRRGSTRSTISRVRNPKTWTAIRSPGPTPSVRARSSPMAAWRSGGVAPEIPVEPGSLPNRRAASKSTPTTCECGAESTCGPVDVTAPSIHVSARTPSMSPCAIGRYTLINCRWSIGPRVDTISSTGPRCVRAIWRIDAFIVSPTTIDPVMIAAPSSEPRTTSDASRGRRSALRTARRRSTGRRTTTTRNGSESTRTTRSAAAVIARLRDR